MPMRRTRSALALLLLAVAPSAAQQAKPVTLKEVPVDRVVAIVGQRPILFSEVMEAVNVQRQQGQLELPSDSAGQMAVARRVLSDLVDEEVLVAAARQYKADVTDADVAPAVDKRLKEIRAQFKTDAEFKETMKREGFGTVEEYRKLLVEQSKKTQLQQRAVDSLRAHGRIVRVAVSEDEVTEAFNKSKDRLPRRPATVSFRQIIVPTRPSAAAKKAALAHAESLYVEVNEKGADFEAVARRESMDPGSKELGGDLGWNRRSAMVPEFERVMFALSPGQISPVIETSFGYHIIRVDRVQPAEVKARHILIVPALDSNDVVNSRLEADSVARLWRAGTPYDTLVAHHHDNAEDRVIPEGMAIDSLPEPYRKGIEGVKVGQIAPTFEIPNPRTGKPKFVVLQVNARSEAGQYTVADLRDRIRNQLSEEKAYRRAIDQLRKEQFVSIKM
jgi:peptidyl-prolyl cis-trans isomerase SurA